MLRILLLMKLLDHVSHLAYTDSRRNKFLQSSS